MIFIDTNYFLRFLLRDVDTQFIEVRKTFEDGASGKTTLFSSTIVFFEIYWLFKSFFRKSDKEIYYILKNILEMKFIFFNESEILKKCLNIYKDANLGLEDSYNLVFARSLKASEFKTFDMKLNKKWKTQK